MSYLPRFICSRYINKSSGGHFKAASLYIDFAGFTAMTEKLMKRGIEGAEILSDILNNLFFHLGNIVQGNRGFITQFVGDAFFAVFPEDTRCIDAATASVEMIQLLRDKKLQRSHIEEYDITGKIGLSSGNVIWGIIGKSGNKSYYFKGEAVKKCILSIGHASAGMITADRAFCENLDDTISTRKINNEFYEIIPSEIKSTDTVKIIDQCDFPFMEDFFPDEILSKDIRGEFRDIANLFIGFEELTDDLIIRTKEIAKFFGKHNLKIIFGDKGETIFITFGAPVAYENSIERAVNMALHLREKLSCRLKAGITSGRVFSGLIGCDLLKCYDVLGSAVNLSARLMEYSDWDRILICREINDSIREFCETEFIGKKLLKGFEKPVTVYELTDRKKLRESQFFSNKMVGRTAEKNNLINMCKPVFKGKFAGITYIYGNAGIGKSRLAYEMISSLRDRAKILILQTDNIIQKGLNCFEYAFREYFNQHIEKDQNAQKMVFCSIYDDLVRELEDNSSDPRKGEIISELKRTESIIAALIGIYWENSLYESLDNRSRYENTLFAIKNLIKAQSLLKPVIILLDDLHWIDDSSKEAFEVLTRNIENYPVAIVIASRYRDDGTKPALNTAENIEINEICLDYLDRSSIKIFIQMILKKSVNKSLFDFIRNKTYGNPFYIEQFCLFLRENNMLELKDNELSLIKSDIEIPSTINRILTSRIDRLSPELKNAVQLASVLGKEFEVEVLFRLIMEVNNNISYRKANHLVEIGKNEQIWAPISEIFYIFKHTLLYDSIYGMQLKSQLRLVHEIAAGILVSLYSGREERFIEIAHHFYQSRNKEKAALYYQKAAAYLSRIYDNKKAIEAYNKLLSLITERSEKIPVILELSELLSITGHWDDAIHLLKNALKAINAKNGEIINECRLKYKLSSLYTNKGEYADSMKLLNDIIVRLKRRKKKEFRSILSSSYGMLAINYHSMSDYKTALNFYNKQKIVSEKIRDLKETGRVMINMGLLHFERGQFDNALECYERARTIHEKLGDKSALAGIYLNMGLLYFAKDELEKALECYSYAKAVQTEIGNKKEMSLIIGNIGNVYFRQGNYQHALDCYTYLKNICTETGDKRGLGMAFANIGSIYYESYGKLDSAELYFKKSIKISEEIGEKFGLSIVSGNLGRLYSEQEKVTKALHFLLYSLNTSRDIGYHSNEVSILEYLSELYYSISDIKKAEQCLSDAFSIIRENNLKYYDFSLKVLDAVIKGITDKDLAAGILQEMTYNFSEDSEQARLYYELWKISGKSSHRKKALSIYESLSKASPANHYKKVLNELKA